MGLRSRRKGHSYERKIAKQLRDEGIFPEAQRQLEYQAHNAKGVDLENTGRLRIQIKRHKKYVNPSQIEEIQDWEGIQTLVTKADNKPAIVCLYWEDFLKIIKDIGEVYDRNY